MKALIVAEQLRRGVPGGIGTYVSGLLGGLAQVGSTEFQPALLASRCPKGDDPLDKWGFPVVTSALYGFLLTRAWDAGLVRLPSSWDVMHATSFAFPSQRKSSSARQTPITVMVHDLAWRGVGDGLPSRAKRWHEAGLRRTLELAAKVITPAKSTADKLMKQGLASERVEVIEHGCDHLPHPDRLGADLLLKKLRIDGPYLLTVGTLEPRKNLPRLFEAYEQALEHLPEPWPLLVVGPPGWGTRLNPPNGVLLTGHISSAVITSLYQQCRLFVYVPFQEGFGLPPVEAMRLGAPTVTSNVPSVNDASFLIDPFDVSAIAKSIVRVATDGDLRNELVERGRQRTRSLTWESAARSHIDVWRSVQP